MIWLLLMVIAVAIVLERRLSGLPLRRVWYSIVPDRRSIEQGELFKLHTVIENKTHYNISYLLVEEVLPGEVQIEKAQTMDIIVDGGYQVVRNVFFVKRRQRLKKSIACTVQRRGVFCFQNAELSFGDFLGLKEKKRTIHQNQSIVVYPRCLKDEKLDRVLSDIMGDVSVRSFMFEDPVLVMGYRDYTGHEPLRKISFPMTAKRNELTVKEYDHTREEMVDIIFDVGYKGNFESYFTQREAAFCVVRTLCEAFEKRGISYRLITNAYYATMDMHGINVIQSGGCGGNSFGRVLDMLGMASGASMCDTRGLLEYTFRNYAQEKEYVYISQRREQENEGLIHSAERRFGTTLHCIYAEDYEKAYLESMQGGKRE